jgi:hypothetical protein
MTKAAAGVITHEVYRRTSSLFWRHTTSYVSDVDLALCDGEFALVLSADEPADLAGAQWVKIPGDASSVVVREYIGDRACEELATMWIGALDPDPVAPLTDSELADQFTAMAWSLMKLDAAPHHRPSPDGPNTLLTAGPPICSRHHPDNLYMMGPSGSTRARRWCSTSSHPTRGTGTHMESIWHSAWSAPPPQLGDQSWVRRTQTGGCASRLRGGPGLGHWLDTGGRHRVRGPALAGRPNPPDVRSRCASVSAGVTLQERFAGTAHRRRLR